MIPPRPMRPTVAVRSWASRSYKVEYGDHTAVDIWEGFPSTGSVYLSEQQPSTHDLSSCAPGYLEWYRTYSHPRVLQDDEDDEPVGRDRRADGRYVSDILYCGIY